MLPETRILTLRCQINGWIRSRIGCRIGPRSGPRIGLRNEAWLEMLAHPKSSPHGCEKSLTECFESIRKFRGCSAVDLSNAEFGFSANVNILKRQESVANLSQFVSFSAFLNKMSLFLFIVTFHILLFCRKRKFEL